MAKNSFILYTEYIDQLELLTMEQRGVLMTAIMFYQDGRELPEMDAVTKMAFSFISSRMKINNDKYDETCKKRAENGKKGGRPKKEDEDDISEEKQEESEKANGFSEKQTKAKKANGFSKKQTKAKKPDNELDLEPELDLDLDLDSLKNNIGHPGDDRPSDHDLEEEFEELWGMYPRKCGDKKKARDNYVKGRKSKVLPIVYDEVKAGIEAYNRKIEDEKTPINFVMHGSTFFNGRRWKDDFTISARDRPPAGRSSAAEEMQDYYDMTARWAGGGGG